MGEGVPHPRGYGNNARVLGEYVRERKVISLEEAVRKMTSLPADHFRFAGRGRLAVGAAADIVIFDPATVGDAATFETPHAYARGIPYVLVMAWRSCGTANTRAHDRGWCCRRRRDSEGFAVFFNREVDGNGREQQQQARDHEHERREHPIAGLSVRNDSGQVETRQSAHRPPRPRATGERMTARRSPTRPREDADDLRHGDRSRGLADRFLAGAHLRAPPHHSR